MDPRRSGPLALDRADRSSQRISPLQNASGIAMPDNWNDKVIASSSPRGTFAALRRRSRGPSPPPRRTERTDLRHPAEYLPDDDYPDTFFVVRAPRRAAASNEPDWYYNLSAKGPRGTVEPAPPVIRSPSTKSLQVARPHIRRTARRYPPASHYARHDGCERAAVSRCGRS